jgi:hypothetical protein
MTLTKVHSPVKGATWFEFQHGSRTGVVAGRGRYWKAAWVSPLRSRPFTGEVAGRSRDEAVQRLVEGLA